MTSAAPLEQQLELVLDDRGPGTPAELLVNRHEITFTTLGPERVQLQAALHNIGDEPSSPTVALVEAAPLGAFVPWQPLLTLPVPSLLPGESYLLKCEAARPKPQPFGPPNRINPRQLLTALQPGEPPRQRSFSDMLKSWVRKPAPAPLPNGLSELLGRGELNWAGNLNVFVEGRAVERHQAGPLRIEPGRVNFALFLVGSGLDAYRFNVHCSQPDWEVRLFDPSDAATALADPGHDQPLKEREWIEFHSMRLINLVMRPPTSSQAGAVQVEVQQRSSQVVAVVEFNLDPQAAGPGCFTL